MRILGFQGLGAFGVSEVTRISADGSTVIAREPMTGEHAVFRVTQDGSFVRFDSPSPPADFLPIALSGDGSIFVGILKNQAVRWTSVEGMAVLGELPNKYEESQAAPLKFDRIFSPWLPRRYGDNQALGVSADGSVIVGVSKNQAFRWTREQGMVGLGSLLTRGGFSEAFGASADGSVVVGWADGEYSGQPRFPGRGAFRWTAEKGMIPLEEVDGGFTFFTTLVAPWPSRRTGASL